MYVTIIRVLIEKKIGITKLSKMWNTTHKKGQMSKNMLDLTKYESKDALLIPLKMTYRRCGVI